MSRKTLLVFAAVALGLLVLAQFVRTKPAAEQPEHGPWEAYRAPAPATIDPATVVWDPPQPTYTPIGQPLPKDDSEQALRDLRRLERDRAVEAERQARRLRDIQDDVDRLQRAQR